MSNKLKEYSREDKIKELKENADYLPDNYLDIVHQLVSQAKEIPKEKPKEILKEKLSLKERKEKVTLEFINKVLEKLDKDEIEKLEDFKILRHELVKINGIDAIKEHIRLLCDQVDGPFDKNKDLKFNMRNHINSYIVTVIKALTKCCGYEFKNVQSTRMIKGNLKPVVIYTICKD